MDGQNRYGRSIWQFEGAALDVLLWPDLDLRYIAGMHIISRKSLRDFWDRYPDSQAPLTRWFKIVQKSTFASFAQLRYTFPSADKVGDLVVFNIGCNKYRLIASIHFNRQKLYIRQVLTHVDYDKGDWKR